MLELCMSIQKSLFVLMFPNVVYHSQYSLCTPENTLSEELKGGAFALCSYVCGCLVQVKEDVEWLCC